MKEVNKAMNAGRILRGHDLTQEVYGHLLDGESNVIGLVIEATKGRSVQLGDRALLYDAVAKLQRHAHWIPPRLLGAVCWLGAAGTTRRVPTGPRHGPVHCAWTRRMWRTDAALRYTSVRVWSRLPLTERPLAAIARAQ